MNARTFVRGSAVLVLVLVALSGCSAFVSPHHVYAPLLDHAGQVDIAARAGPTIPGGAGVSLNAAYAPVDHLEIVGGGDINVGDETTHYAGHLGIGTFVRDDVFRLELTAGSYGGYAEGIADGFGCGSVSGSVSGLCGLYRVSGAYALPYGQVLIGFESGHFELAGGFRVMGSFADISIDAISATTERAVRRDGYERLYVEPVVTIRIPFDIVRIDIQTGWPFNPRGVGDSSPGDLASELDVMWYFAVGVGFQFDTIEQPHPEPEYIPPPPPPVYAPVPVSAPPPAATTPPPPPAGYESSAPSESSIITPIPPPPPSPAPPPASP